ncbi:DUF6044 family protein [Treponema primitia]|uniref:DUF6044 family protein n=1 Tax=Treponema primitia TaxID=88058 RepID=UPI0002554EE1|nr:DUF6044 family protein [Treponema primitia]
MKIKIAFFLIFPLIFILPLIIFGENSIITVFDNLDSNIPFSKMIRDNHLFFKLDAPTKILDGMSSQYLSHSFSFKGLTYYLFDTYVAYVINAYLGTALSLISMYLLLKRLIGIPTSLSILVSACYSIIPIFPGWNIAIGVLPLIILIFHYFSKNYEFSWKSLLLLFFPLFSSFVGVGWFILALWFMATIIFCVKDKRINLNLLIGFIVLCIGYILVDFRLFYLMFVIKEPLNRVVWGNRYHTADLIPRFKIFIRNIKRICISSGNPIEAPAMQHVIILPVAFLTTLVFLVKYFVSIKKRPKKLITK